ncbi:WYL domain-containing protein [Burkholderia pseudomallei]
MALAAQNALAKIGGVLPPEMRRALDDDALYVGRKKEDTSGLDLAKVRQAMREQRKMRIIYTNQNGTTSDRTIWPIMLGFVESRRFIAGWCELRGDFRLFRTDRIVKVDFLDDHYARNRRQLVKEWRAQEALRRKQHDDS